MKTIWWAEPHPINPHLTVICTRWEPAHLPPLEFRFAMNPKYLELSVLPPHAYLGEVARNMTYRLQSAVDRG